MAGGVYAAEPAWRCACCDVFTHVRCFCAFHPDLPTVTNKFESRLKSAGFLYQSGIDGVVKNANHGGSGGGGIEGGIYGGDGAALDSPSAGNSPISGALYREHSLDSNGLGFLGVNRDRDLNTDASLVGEEMQGIGNGTGNPFAIGSPNLARKDSLGCELDDVQRLDECSLGPMQ